MTATTVVRNYIDAVNAHDWDAVAELTTEGLAGAVREGMWRGNPDFAMHPTWMVEHDGKVTLWLFGTGTHTAPWALPPSAGALAGQTLSATGRTWRASCSVTYEVRDGRIVDVWGVWDLLAILDQLGAITIGN